VQRYFVQIRLNMSGQFDFLMEVCRKNRFVFSLVRRCKGWLTFRPEQKIQGAWSQAPRVADSFFVG
jgi:hypothetical protein